MLYAVSASSFAVSERFRQAHPLQSGIGGVA